MYTAIGDVITHLHITPTHAHPNILTHKCTLSLVQLLYSSGPYEFDCVGENSAVAGQLVGTVSVTDGDLVPGTTGFPIHMLTATIESDDSVRCKVCG